MFMPLSYWFHVIICTRLAGVSHFTFYMTLPPSSSVCKTLMEPKRLKKTAHFLHLLVQLLWNFLSSPCRLSSRSLADACCKQTLGFFTWNSKNCSADFFLSSLVFSFCPMCAWQEQHSTELAPCLCPYLKSKHKSTATR